VSTVAIVVLYTTLAGAAIPLGGALASIERLRPRWLEQELRHGVLAFGGGVLLAAVALVLVPEGTRHLSPAGTATSLLAGGGVFLLLDRGLARRGTPASNLLATVLDFAPEAIALGALITEQPRLGALLAMFIAMQNLPEGFNAYRELTASGERRGRVLTVLAAAVLVGPACGLLGLWTLSDAPQITAVIMVFASGGILYLMFQDIAPQARLDRAWGPPLGAVLGFCFGVVGNQLLGH
jgi:ZIP family zinc transporter